MTIYTKNKLVGGLGDGLLVGGGTGVWVETGDSKGDTRIPQGEADFTHKGKKLTLILRVNVK